MFWNVTFIYNAFIRTTDHCKVQTAFVSLFYIFINMKSWNASNSSVVVGLLLIMQISKLFHWKATPTRAFNEFLYEFFNFGKFVKIREFFFAEVTNSRSMPEITDTNSWCRFTDSRPTQPLSFDSRTTEKTDKCGEDRFIFIHQLRVHTQR